MMHSGLRFSLVLCGKRKKVRRKIMKFKLTGPAGLAAAFVAGMLVATALGGGIVAGTPAAKAAQWQQVTVQRVITPTVTDADIELLRKDLRAMKMQVVGQNMSLSEEQGLKFWPVYNHYVKDLQAQALRLKYVPIVSQVLPGREAATFFQIDRRLNMMIDLQLFSQIPLAYVKAE
jgi:hypothetical protein